MHRLPFQKLQHETRFVLHVTRRDTAKRLAAFALILLICWHGGATAVLWLLGGLVLAVEGAALAITRAARRTGRQIPRHLALAMWATNVSSTMFYVLPAVVLAGQGSAALLLAGFLWLFGVMVHLSNTFIALPLYNLSQMIAATLVALAVVWRAAGTTITAGTRVDWGIVAALMVVYVANTLETLARQKDTQAALDAARAEATARLAALERISRHDPLTGLINRRAFDEELAGWLAEGRSGIAVFVIDLDDFKPINDTYSHAAGDAVLVDLARRLLRFSDESGIVARLGGDEFIIALPAPDTAEGVMALAGRMLEAIETPVCWNGKTLRIGASIGIALTDTVTREVQPLCAAADHAMFRAKSDGGTKAMVFDPAQFPPRPSLEDRRILAAALRSGAIRPHYQPKVRLATGTPIGFEALARWHHPERGLLLPADFLPQIDDLGLQGEFLMAMTEAVLVDIAALLAAGCDPGQVSVNIPEVALATRSGRADLERLLSQAPAAARHLTFEITEDVFIARAGGPIQEGIAAFRRAGLRISLDDFGTGFASFQHLRQLEFDELKIDRSFVADLDSDATAQLLVGAFLDIGRGFGVDVIAEGVETEAQRLLLVAMGCRFGQGYRFGAAMPFGALCDLLRGGAGVVPAPVPSAAAARAGSLPGA